jgi:hypothetical protein
MVMVLGSVEDKRTFSNLAFVKLKLLELAYFAFGFSCLHVYLRILLPGNIPILHFNLCMEGRTTPLWDDIIGLMQVCHLFWVFLYGFTTLRLCLWFYTNFV